MGGSGRFFPRIEPEERKRALDDPGPSWRQYFYFSFAKVWTVLAFFISDSFLVSYWAIPFNPVGLGLSLAGAFYIEYLGYQYLWHRPAEPIRGRPTKAFQRDWLHPVPYGRWTPEAERAKEGKPAVPGFVDEGPDPKEFL